MGCDRRPYGVGFQSTQREARASALGLFRRGERPAWRNLKSARCRNRRGEKLVHLTDALGSATGIDIDPEMVDTDRQNLPIELFRPDRLSQRHSPIDRHAGFICRSGAQPALGC